MLLIFQYQGIYLQTKLYTTILNLYLLRSGFFGFSILHGIYLQTKLYSGRYGVVGISGNKLLLNQQGI